MLLDHFPQKSRLRSVGSTRAATQNTSMAGCPCLGVCLSLGSGQARDEIALSKYLFPCLRSLHAWFSLLKPKERRFWALAEVLGVREVEMPAVPKAAEWRDVRVGDCLGARACALCSHISSCGRK